jgi:Predicted cobalamin binding protein
MINDSVFLNYFSSLLEGDKIKCSLIVKQLFEEGVELKDIYVNLFQKSLYRIGRKWEKKEISIATEHIATQITIHLMSLVFSFYKKATPLDKTIILFCVDKEFHEIGIKMVSDIFELHGWQCYFMGANNPERCVISAIEEKQPDLIGVSFNFYMNIGRFISTIECINIDFPDLQILIGGQALTPENDELFSRFHNVTYLPTLDDVEKYILTFK